MPQIENAHGITFTAAAPASVAAFDKTVHKYLSFRKDTGEALKALLEIEPDMPMALCLRGNFFMLMGVRGLVGKALQAAQKLEQRTDLNARERQHVAALLAWCNDSLARATQIWDEIAAEHPRDIFAIKMEHFGHFYLGNPRGIRDCVARALDFWSERDDAHSYLMSMYAFGLEECGNPWQAEAVARDAVARQPADPWGIHAVAHALEATGRTADGISWIESVGDHATDHNNFRYHLAWHKALFRFEQGDYDGALRDYDEFVFADTATEYLDICNDASMLMRLELGGASPGERWRAAAAKVAPRIDERVLAFADVHYVLALSSSPDPAHREMARSMTASMETYAGTGADNALSYRVAAVPAARAVLAFRDQQYGDAVRFLDLAAPGLHCMGGSNAQRDLFSELKSAGLYHHDPKSTDTAAFLAARSRSHPGNRRNWTLYLDTLARRGDTAASQAAQARMAAPH